MTQVHDNTNDSISKGMLVRSIETGLTVTSIRKDGILEIRFKKDKYEVDVNDQTEIQNAVFKLTNNGKDSYHIMVIPGLYGGITKEARDKETFQSTVFKDHRSISIITKNISQRILGKFYYSLKKDKPAFPFMFFKSEELCVEWINQNK